MKSLQKYGNYNCSLETNKFFNLNSMFLQYIFCTIFQNRKRFLLNCQYNKAVFTIITVNFYPSKVFPRDHCIIKFWRVTITAFF
jgi:hypothetical protein